MDLAVEIGERSLEVVRAHVEAAAARDRDEAAARLLLELELEDAGKKVAPATASRWRACSWTRYANTIWQMGQSICPAERMQCLYEALSHMLKSAHGLHVWCRRLGRRG